MGRTLFIGDYYPEFSYRSKLNQIVAENISELGEEIFLLSSSWCNITEENFYGDVEQLSQKGPFKQKYFIDPIQVRDSNLELINAYLGLGCKIIECEKIDKIVFADKFIYIPALVILKKLYGLSCVYLAWESNALYTAMDDYVRPYTDMLLETFDKIITYPDYIDSWKNLFNRTESNFISASPIKNILIDWNEIEIKKVFLLCENNSNVALTRLLKKVKHKFNCHGQEVIIAMPNKDILNRIKIDGSEYNVINVDEVPERALVISDCLLCEGNMINISCVLTMLSCKFIPLVGEEYSKWIQWSGAKYSRVGDLYAIQGVDITCATVEEILV